MRIGLLGGSFNPAHEGHSHASELALKQLGLDYVWWLVSPQNPLKATGGMASFGERLEGARNFNRHPRVIVTDIENRLGTRFTIDTLARLEAAFSATALRLADGKRQFAANSALAELAGDFRLCARGGRRPARHRACRPFVQGGDPLQVRLCFAKPSHCRDVAAGLDAARCAAATHRARPICVKTAPRETEAAMVVCVCRIISVNEEWLSCGSDGNLARRSAL